MRLRLLRWSQRVPKRSLKPKKGWRARVLKAIRVYLCPFLVLLASTASAQTFQQLRKTISASPSTQPESTILQFLELGLEQGKPTQTIMETEKWLRQNLPGDGIYKAAQAAELAGIGRTVAYYQQYLEKLISSQKPDEAVYVVYSILIHQLKDTSAVLL